KNRYRVNLHLRVLADLLNGVKSGVFLGVVDGKEHPPALIVQDPLGIGNLAAQFGFFGGEESAYIVFDNSVGGLWYLSEAKKTAKHGRGKPLSALADARHYAIDTTIQGLEITARTTMQLDLLEDLRVLPIHILPKLRLSKATYRVGEGEPVEAAIIQEEVELGKFARLFRLEVADADAAVVFTERLKKGSKVELTLDYAGRDVLFSIGADTYSVSARDSWYPNVGTFTDIATYELTFRYPKRLQLISVGERVSEKDEEKQRVSVWRSSNPIRVAGFNYGRFEKKSQSDPDSGMTVDVYANREFTKFSGDTMADAINSARVSTIFFGKVPYSPISVTQQVEWSFGQSWPSLVYLPTLAFTSQTERVMELGDVLGPNVADLNEFAKMVGWHEVAHQWWGHHVGWESYRDQWLSEGFAEFTSALVLQFTESFRKYDDYWERRRREIIEKSRGNQMKNFEAGAISQGFRLSTHRTPSAASTILYGKGGYVLHMIRMMLRGGKNPDERFIALMHDFVESYAEKNPSTADFKQVVERHMTPQMNLTGDGKMDWFFDQWVHGMEIPKIKSEIKFADAGGGKYKLTGSVTQEGVSPKFRTLMPMYVDFGKDQIARIGVMLLEGNQTVPFEVELPLPRAPKKILPNAMHDVLVLD
ncbi:MAG TPA: M1 family aminopeptidase, partial [Thermoanaerobaculia bacterium]